jgi:hypothetical protein
MPLLFVGGIRLLIPVVLLSCRPRTSAFVGAVNVVETFPFTSHMIYSDPIHWVAALFARVVHLANEKVLRFTSATGTGCQVHTEYFNSALTFTYQDLPIETGSWKSSRHAFAKSEMGERRGSWISVIECGLIDGTNEEHWNVMQANQVHLLVKQIRWFDLTRTCCPASRVTIRR